MKFTRRQVIILLAGVVVVAALIFLFYYVTRKPATGPTITLNVWGVDDAAAMSDLGAAYSAFRPGITIKYTQVDPAQYETQLLKAFAAGTGPDVFEIPNRSLPRWQAALAPLPTSSTQFNLALMQQTFPSVVANDFTTPAGRIYAVPLSIDTLALFYNKDYLDAAGIALPPATWNEFDNDIPRLRQLDASGQLSRAAAPLGGTRASMANADDILYLLMLQNGTQMISDDRTYATFADAEGQAAAQFYLQFSNAGSPYYTWNDSVGDARETFAQGKSAVYFGYHGELAAIHAQAPFLNIAIAPMPQPASSTLAVNYPKYYGLAAAKTGNSAYAWDFILYSTIYASGENLFLKDTGAPAAQRGAIATQETAAVAAAGDPSLSIFAKQALSAKSWYEPDDIQTDAAFDSMLQGVLNGSAGIPTALRSAEDAVTGMLRKQ
jgi:ABC-type glycerol-3-phosphate transport system substrate-binding protein